MNQDTCMQVAVYAVIAIVVILVIRYFLSKENFANEHHHKHNSMHHRMHHHGKHEHKHEQEHKAVGNQPLNVGTQYTLSPDTDGWMRVRQQGTQNYANIAASDVWVDNTLHVNSGNIELNNNKLYFDSPNNNSSDPYYIQKIVTSPNNSSLRLTINDDADESFQVWGNSCGEQGGCGGPGAMKHKFGATGNATHQGDLIVHGDILLRRNDGNDIAIQQDGNVCLRNSSNGNNISCWNSTVSGGVVLAGYDLPYPRVSN